MVFCANGGAIESSILTFGHERNMKSLVFPLDVIYSKLIFTSVVSYPSNILYIYLCCCLLNWLLLLLVCFLALLNPESEKMTTRVDLQLESDDSNSDDSDNDEDDEEENDDDDDDDEAENRIEEVVDEEERDTVGEGVASMAKGNNVTTNPSSSSSSAALPTIQIQFAIGHMKDDSIIKLLSGKDSDSDGNERDDKDDDDYGSVNEGNAKKRAIENLLLSSNSGGKEESTSKKTKQWVTELS